MRVLFVCTANSCRSQMAEAWARHLWPEGWRAESAGIVTYPITAPTRAAMAEAGVSLEGQRTKPIDDVWLEDFDLVVTLSEEAQRFLPPLGEAARHLHAPVEDPMALTGAPQEVLPAFREARDLIRDLVAGLPRRFGDGDAGDGEGADGAP